jgi:hypothetical protein
MSLSPLAVQANMNTLTQAMSAASVSSSPSGSEAELKEELEDGEIREDDGTVKTVFDDAGRFNVKVGGVVTPLTTAPFMFDLDTVLRLAAVQATTKDTAVYPCDSIPHTWWVSV